MGSRVMNMSRTAILAAVVAALSSVAANAQPPMVRGSAITGSGGSAITGSGGVRIRATAPMGLRSGPIAFRLGAAAPRMMAQRNRGLKLQ